MHKKQSRPQTPVIIIIKPWHIQGHRSRTPGRDYVLILDTKISHCVGQFLQMSSSKRHHEMLKIIFVSLEYQTRGLPHFTVINWAAGWFSSSTLWCGLKPRAGTLSPLAVFHLAHSLDSSRNVSTNVTTTMQQWLILLSGLLAWQM